MRKGESKSDTPTRKGAKSFKDKGAKDSDKSFKDKDNEKDKAQDKSFRRRGTQGVRATSVLTAAFEQDHHQQQQAAVEATVVEDKRTPLDGSVKVAVRINLALPGKDSGTWPLGRTMRVDMVYVPEGHYVRGRDQVVPGSYAPPPRQEQPRPRLSPLDKYRVRHGKRLLSSLPPAFDGRLLPPATSPGPTVGNLGFRSIAQLLLDSGVHTLDLFTAKSKMDLLALAKLNGIELKLPRDSYIDEWQTPHHVGRTSPVPEDELVELATPSSPVPKLLTEEHEGDMAQGTIEHAALGGALRPGTRTKGRGRKGKRFVTVQPPPEEMEMDKDIPIINDRKKKREDAVIKIQYNLRCYFSRKTLGHHYRAGLPDGTRWERLGVEAPPHGINIRSASLVAAIHYRGEAVKGVNTVEQPAFIRFTTNEWSSMGIPRLLPANFIRVDGSIWRPFTARIKQMPSYVIAMATRLQNAFRKKRERNRRGRRMSVSTIIAMAKSKETGEWVKLILEECIEDSVRIARRSTVERRVKAMISAGAGGLVQAQGRRWVSPGHRHEPAARTQAFRPVKADRAFDPSAFKAVGQSESVRDSHPREGTAPSSGGPSSFTASHLSNMPAVAATSDIRRASPGRHGHEDSPLNHRKESISPPRGAGAEDESGGGWRNKKSHDDTATGQHLGRLSPADELSMDEAHAQAEDVIHEDVAEESSTENMQAVLFEAVSTWQDFLDSRLWIDARIARDPSGGGPTWKETAEFAQWLLAKSRPQLREHVSSMYGTYQTESSDEHGDAHMLNAESPFWRDQGDVVLLPQRGKSKEEVEAFLDLVQQSRVFPAIYPGMASMNNADWRLYWSRVRKSFETLFSDTRRSCWADAAAADARTVAILQGKTTPKQQAAASHAIQIVNKELRGALPRGQDKDHAAHVQAGRAKGAGPSAFLASGAARPHLSTAHVKK